MTPRTLSVLLAVFTFTLAARAELASSPAEVKPLPVGAKVPAALVKSVEGTDLSLVDLVALKPTVLIFYRGSWCPYCNRHLAALNEVEPELLKLGYQILAISPDDLPGLRTATEKNHLNYRLFSDQGMQASAAFGLAFRVDAKTIQAYTGYGISLAAVPGEPDARWLPVPAVYIIGRDGEVKFVHSNPDYKARLTAYQVMTAAKSAL